MTDLNNPSNMPSHTPSNSAPTPLSAGSPRMESLLTAEDLAAKPRTAVGPTAREQLNTWVNAKLADPVRRARLKRAGLAATLAIALGGGAAAVWAFMPRSAPDYALDPVDDALNYTFMTADFNNLPIEQRLELIKTLVARFKDAQSGDSVLLAQFAAGIDAEARKQIFQNASKLMLDVADREAIRYQSLRGAEREKAIEDAFVGMVHAFQVVAGEEPEDPDKLIADAKAQNQRDAERLESMSAERKGDMGARMFNFMNNQVAGNSSPQQKARLTTLMSDMSKHFRKQ